MWFTMCCFTRNWSLSMLFNHSDSECDSLCPALLGIGVFLCCSINQITRIQNVIHGGFRMWFTMCCFTRNLSLFVLFNSANSECDSLGAALLGIGVFSCCSITRIQNVIRGRFGMCFTRLNNTSSGAVWSKEPPPPGGLLFTMFPHQEPWVRGRPSKNLYQVLWGGSSYSWFLRREHK